MKTWYTVFNILGVAVILIWLGITIKTQDELQSFYDAQALKIQTEYATEAALYTYSANDVYWLDTYKIMMCNQANMGSNNEAVNRVLDSTSAAVFVSEESIEYLTRNTEKDKFECEILVSKKDIDAGYVILNLFKDNITFIKKDSLDTTKANNIEELRTALAVKNININSDLDSIKKYRKIYNTETINDALIRSFVGMNDTAERVAYIPVFSIEELGINSIEDKTIVVVQKDFAKWNNNIITTAGYAKVERDWIVGYVEDGVKYYCNESEAPDVKNKEGNKLFKTIYEAADAGYIPDIKRMR